MTNRVRVLGRNRINGLGLSLDLICRAT